MLSTKTPFHGFNNRNRNFSKANIKMPHILRSLQADQSIFPCFLKTRAGLNLVSKWLIHPKWNHRIYHRKMLNLQNATQQPSYIDGEIQFHVPLGPLSVRGWFGIVFHIANNEFIGALFIDCLICEIFSSDRETVFWPFHPVAILASSKNIKSANPNTAVVSARMDETYKTNIEVEEISFPICMAR